MLGMYPHPAGRAKCSWCRTAFVSARLREQRILDLQRKYAYFFVINQELHCHLFTHGKTSNNLVNN
jgi:hypothetical protein